MDKVEKHAQDSLKLLAAKLANELALISPAPKIIIAHAVRRIWQAAMFYCPDQMGMVLAEEGKSPKTRNYFGFCGNQQCENRIVGGQNYCSVCQPKVDAECKSPEERRQEKAQEEHNKGWVSE